MTRLRPVTKGGPINAYARRRVCVMPGRLKGVSDHRSSGSLDASSTIASYCSIRPPKPHENPESAAMASDESTGSAELSQVRSYWSNMLPNSPIYTFLLKDIELVSASHGSVKAYLEVKEVHINSKGRLHGVVSTCITDSFGGLAIATTGLEKTGVSTDIHTTYVSAAKIGDTLEIEAKANKIGRSLAFTSVEIRHKGGDIVATGTHTKFIKV